VARVPHVGTGDLLRDLEPADPAYQRAHALTGRGDHADDELVLTLLRERLRGAKTPVVLDGFPRTLAQLGAYDHDPRFGARGLTALFVALVCPAPTCVERMTRRQAIEERHDDHFDVLTRRIANHTRMSRPVMVALAGRLTTVVSSDRAVQQIVEEILEITRGGDRTSLAGG
jgi:adenylate kinase